MEKLTQLLTDLLAEVKKAEAGPPPPAPALAEAPAVVAQASTEIPATAPISESDEEDFVDMPDSKSEADLAEAPAKAPAEAPAKAPAEAPAEAPLPSAAQTIKDLEDLIDKNKDYYNAALIIQNRPDLRTEFFNFFASRWWRDFQEWTADEEAPKAVLWEVLLLNNIVRWQDLWSLRMDETNSLGLIVLFRGTEKLRQHMLDVAIGDPVFLKLLHDKAVNLFNVAAEAVLPRVLPYIQSLVKDGLNFNQFIEAFNKACAKGNRERFPERVRQCLVYLAKNMATAK